MSFDLNPAKQLVQAMQHNDADIRQIIRTLTGGNPDKQIKQNYVLVNGLVHRRLRTPAEREDCGSRRERCQRVL
jgi:hypothetical protein